MIAFTRITFAGLVVVLSFAAEAVELNDDLDGDFYMLSRRHARVSGDLSTTDRQSLLIVSKNYFAAL